MAEQPLPQPPPPQPRPPLPRAERLPRMGARRPMCCPYQTSIEDIRVIIFDIKNDGRLHLRFKDVQDRRLSKVDASAALRYAGKPVTARRNPSNPPPWNEVGKEQPEDKKGGVSYQIIRVQNTREPEDRGKMVDLLIDEQSHYCLGFRSGFEDENQNERWSGWFRARGNYAWPSFLAYEDLPIHGDHELQVEIGGSDTFNDILRGLWRYPTNRHDVASLHRAFLRAVVMLCETLRQLSIWLEVYRRVTEDSPASPLPLLYWKRMRNWKSACEFILDTASRYHGWIPAAEFWTRFHDLLGYQSFDAMVNEMRFFIWLDFLRENHRSEEKRWLMRKQPGIEVENPAFLPSTVPEVPAEVQEV